MQSFTTQSHQRNYQGNVVVENPNRALARLNRQQKRGNIIAGITTSVMALAVAVTGSLLGAATIHNRQLKNQIRALETQDAPMVATVQTDDTLPDGACYYPMTLEARPDNEETGTNLNRPEGAHFDFPIMTLEAKPEDTPTRDEANEAPAQQPRDEHHRRHGKRIFRHASPTDKEHQAQPLPAVKPMHNHQNNADN